MQGGSQGHEKEGLDLQRQITLTLPSERRADVFDAEDFDAIKFINQIYPDGVLDASWLHACSIWVAGHDVRGKALSQKVCVAWTNPAAMLFAPCAEASLSDVDRFAAVLRKQVGSEGMQ